LKTIAHCQFLPIVVKRKKTVVKTLKKVIDVKNAPEENKLKPS